LPSEQFALKFSWLQVTWGISSVVSASWHAGRNGHFPVVKKILTVAHFVLNRMGLLKEWWCWCHVQWITIFLFVGRTV